MSFAQLKEKVLHDAEQEKERLVKEAKEKAEQIKQSAEQEAQQYEQQKQRETDEEVARIRRQKQSVANLEVRKQQLAAKKELVDNVFERVKDELPEKLSEGDRKELINALLRKAQQQVDVARIYCNETDSQYVDLGETELMDMLGGIIAENADGTIRIDYSFETLIDSMKEQHMSDIAKVLFTQ